MESSWILRSFWRGWSIADLADAGYIDIIDHGNKVVNTIGLTFVSIRFSVIFVLFSELSFLHSAILFEVTKFSTGTGFACALFPWLIVPLLILILRKFVARFSATHSVSLDSYIKSLVVIGAGEII